jgi:hypothetical protein
VSVRHRIIQYFPCFHSIRVSIFVYYFPFLDVRDFI